MILSIIAQSEVVFSITTEFLQRHWIVLEMLLEFQSFPPPHPHLRHTIEFMEAFLKLKHGMRTKDFVFREGKLYCKLDLQDPATICGLLA